MAKISGFKRDKNEFIVSVLTSTGKASQDYPVKLEKEEFFYLRTMEPGGMVEDITMNQGVTIDLAD